MTDELRLAIRRLTTRPAATLAGVITLAFSIGAATATWSLLSAVLLRPLPIVEPDRLMVAGSRIAQGPDAGGLRNSFIYLAVQRTREMGIRAALGARGGQLAAIVLTETGRLVGIGLLVGLTIVYAGANTIRAFLFGIQPLDPTTLAAVATLLLALAMVVSVRPALRAAQVDLASVLREE